ncbi:MAG: hypothetical protein ACOYK8_05835 [Alphaproteobacteria bacterium]
MTHNSQTNIQASQPLSLKQTFGTLINLPTGGGAMASLSASVGLFILSGYADFNISKFEDPCTAKKIYDGGQCSATELDLSKQIAHNRGVVWGFQMAGWALSLSSLILGKMALEDLEWIKKHQAIAFSTAERERPLSITTQFNEHSTLSNDEQGIIRSIGLAKTGKELEALKELNPAEHFQNQDIIAGIYAERGQQLAEKEAPTMAFRTMLATNKVHADYIFQQALHPKKLKP